jgi:hypothetical protein
MRTTLGATIAALLLAVTAPSAFAAAPTNDEMANATTITSLTFSASPDLSQATVEAGENVDCGFASTRTVWYRYVVPGKQLLQVDVSSADPDGGVRIYYEYSGYPPTLGNCISLQYSGYKFMIEPVTTLWFQLSVNTGTSATLTITSLPLLHVSATLDQTAISNAKAGTVTIGGTLTCSIPARGSAAVTLHQRQGRTVVVSQGYSDQMTCGPTPVRWTAILSGQVTAGLATADWQAAANIFGPPDQYDQVIGSPTTVTIKKR